ncbi:MAG: DUF1593 domain-containing protein [Bacteroidaceae bacterium]|nr:DUF1593 domain-containing protein [Bacteroidaceae bacterium]
MRKTLCTLWFLTALPACAQIASTTGEGLNYADGWAIQAPLSEKPRIIITADPELDDNNSMIRFILFSTDYKVEGLIYASSQFHWKGDGKGTKSWVPGREYDKPGLNFKPMTHYRWDEGERFIDNVVDAYEPCYPNLKAHHPDYPTPEYLRSKIAWGNVEFDGDFSKDTPGSELIKRVLMDETDPSPVFVQAWGGCSTIARALKSIEDIYSQQPGYEQLKARISKKMVLCLSGDQDNCFARYIRPFWPDIKQQPVGVGAASLSYMSPMMARSEEAKQIYGAEWTKKNISDQGPMGEIYRVWGDGKQFAKGDIFDFFGFADKSADELRKEGYVVWCPIQPKGTFLGEGDTGCFLNLIDNGLQGYVQNWGGWAGYQRRAENKPQSITQADVAAVQASLGVGAGAGNAATNRRDAEAVKTPDFLPAVMNGFAARLHWAVTPKYEDANHDPVISGPQSLKGKPGETLKLKYTITDPDKGQEVHVTWWKHPISTYTPDCNVADRSNATTAFTIPADAKPGDEIHLILEAQDNGSLPLTRYNRLVVTVE